jgi:sigma-B regulation protein RsbU (phosphoserine phosphatase)
LREELNSTEMFITLFYGVIDPTARELRYANTGHPHAFLISPEGTVTRLPALDPPLGMVDERPTAVVRPWRGGADLLLLFTDGVSDARDLVDQRLGEQPVLDVVRVQRAAPTSEILEQVFAALGRHTSGAPLRDDLTLVVVRS